MREVLSMPFGHGSSRCVVLKLRLIQASTTRTMQTGPRSFLDWTTTSFVLTAPVKLGKYACTSVFGNILSLSFDPMLGKECLFVAVVMFKVEYAVRLGYTSSTSQMCNCNEQGYIISSRIVLL